jgi:hypothetical protein
MISVHKGLDVKLDDDGQRDMVRLSLGYVSLANETVLETT